MKLSVCGKTDRGKKRLNNEDDLAAVDLAVGAPIDPIQADDLPVAERGILLAVCDGVGGRRAGEVASALALHTLSEEIDKLADGCPRQTLFRTAVENVNERVWKEAKTDAELAGMATTLTAAVVCRTRTLIAHVGDSRAYLIRGDQIRQLTRDQTFVASLIESGALSEEDAARSPYRSMILQAIGREKKVHVALDGLELVAKDLLLLCTDGLSEKVRPSEMAEAFRSHPLCEAVDSLIALANDRGGDDNITVIVIRVGDTPAA
jgi:serine/threonine protein phosphatase PrpC